MRVTTILSLLFALASAPVTAHELWIEPEAYQLGEDSAVTARLVNGQNFEGVEIRYFPKDFVRFTLTLGNTEQPIEGRIGDSPALNMPALGDGLHIATYQSSGAVVNYSALEKFARFAKHKDLSTSLGADVLERHAARNLPTENFNEYYTRYSKALVAVGDGVGADRRMGLETELVALANPYTDDLSAGLPVQLFYGDAPRADAQIELFAKAPDGSVVVTLHRTDADGIVRLPVSPGTAYLVDAVLLREPGEGISSSRPVVWETLWAALNFAVPE
jgi:uncharacterized GH25 family protein